MQIIKEKIFIKYNTGEWLGKRSLGVPYRVVDIEQASNFTSISHAKDYIREWWPEEDDQLVDIFPIKVTYEY